jgi:hypothetical protein
MSHGANILVTTALGHMRLLSPSLAERLLSGVYRPLAVDFWNDHPWSVCSHRKRPLQQIPIDRPLTAISGRPEQYVIGRLHRKRRSCEYLPQKRY